MEVQVQVGCSATMVKGKLFGFFKVNMPVLDSPGAMNPKSNAGGSIVIGGGPIITPLDGAGPCVLDGFIGVANAC